MQPFAKSPMGNFVCGSVIFGNPLQVGARAQRRVDQCARSSLRFTSKMSTCSSIMSDFAEKMWDSLFRRRYVNPAIFLLCAVIFMSCIGGLYAVHIHEFSEDKSAFKAGWQAFLGSAMLLDVLLVGVLWHKRRAQRLFISSYDEI